MALLNPLDIEAICQGTHPNPFGVLGPHQDPSGATAIRCFLPGAQAVTLHSRQGDLLAALQALDTRGFFQGLCPQAQCADYRLQVRWNDSHTHWLEDPYRIGLLLSALDIWLLAEGTHLRPFEVLGAHTVSIEGVSGTRFAVWAPNAKRVSVVGDFNHWDARRHPMRLRPECGVWELFIAEAGLGHRYKFALLGPDGQTLPDHADPYARQTELRPATASVVAPLPAPWRGNRARQPANALQAPISIYEVHLGSWRRVPEQADRWLNWDELADTLVPYVQEMGFTHLELLPISEHPFDGSWGYQPTGLYAPTARFGEPAGFARLVERCHQAGIGLILDWVPAHFPIDPHGLAQFDGTALYEYANPLEGFHQDWETLIYNLGRKEVANFLVGNALYWLERFGVDGLRVDAVASLLYRDYSREPGQWIPNIHGGRENLEAIAFLKRLNEIIGAEQAQAITLAEESTAFPAVTQPTYAGGLGFHYKWNMGWMNDTLRYLQRDPIYRQHHHGELTFSMVYAFNENFVLPLSHDEVVHGKGSLLSKMPGDRWQQFANVRALLGYQFAHPGKKLLFMGCEFAQLREWNHEQSLDWHLLDDPRHAGVQNLVRDLNHLYRNTPALHARDFSHDGFEWLSHEDAQRSVLAFVRRGQPSQEDLLVVANFTPNVWRDYRLGVPRAGSYREVLNTDHSRYGGSGVVLGDGRVLSQAKPLHRQAQSITLCLPPLSVMFLAWQP